MKKKKYLLSFLEEQESLFTLLLKRAQIPTFAGITLLVFLFSCKQENKSKEITSDLVQNPLSANGEQKGDVPAIVFDKTEHDFGRITQGEKVSYSFRFKNTGESDLIISGAQGSCGCTVPSYPKKPIAPGEEDAIDVVFDSEGKEGKVSKTVTVVTNANPSTQILKITSEIITPTTKN